jgi:hypothetical protein
MDTYKTQNMLSSDLFYCVGLTCVIILYSVQPCLVATGHFLANRPERIWTHPASYSMGTGMSCPKYKVAEGRS